MVSYLYAFQRIYLLNTIKKNMIICTQKVKEVNFITQRNSNLQKVSITTKLIEVNR